MLFYNHFNPIKISIIFLIFSFMLLLPYKANNLFCYSTNTNFPFEEWQASNLDLTIIDTFLSLFSYETKKNYVEFNIQDYEKLKELYKQSTIFTTTYNQNNH